MNDETTKELENLSTLACSTDEGQRRRALVAMLSRVVGRASQVDKLPADEAARIGVLEADLREVTQLRDQWHQKWNTAQNNAETLARDLAEARAEVERLSARLPLEVVLQCLGGVLNDMTRGGDFEKAEARSFHDVACVRLRSLAGSPEEAGRVLTSEELAEADRAMYAARTYADALYWLERKGYLSVRLPPDG